VRVAGNHAYQICFALDAGARGIVVPMVNTQAEAEAAVRACRYHPLGDNPDDRYPPPGSPRAAFNPRTAAPRLIGDDHRNRGEKESEGEP
jgi:hypothetical protein